MAVRTAIKRTEKTNVLLSRYRVDAVDISEHNLELLNAVSEKMKNNVYLS